MDLFLKVSVAASRVVEGGKGLFASQDFIVGDCMAGEIVLAAFDAEAMEKRDHVLLATSYDKFIESGQHVALLQRGKSLFRVSDDNLCKQGYLQWAQQAWPEKTAEKHKEAADVMSLFAYNGFLSQPEGKYHMIYEYLSMANHSCAPNAVLVSSENGPGELVCTQNIRSGEEITLSYLHDSDLYRSIPRRRDLLQEGWDFVCHCIRCESLIDDTRCFACAVPHCRGSCFAENDNINGLLIVEPCCNCGSSPEKETLREWQENESEVSALLDALPSSLYSAWFPCDGFAEAHPKHGLTSEWKVYLAMHTEAEAHTTEDAKEIEELKCDAAKYRTQGQLAIESIVGVPLMHRRS